MRLRVSSDFGVLLAALAGMVRVAIPPDQVDLIGARRPPLVSPDDHHSPPLQKALRQVLGAPPGSLVRGPELLPPAIADPIGQLVQPGHHLITSNSNSITFPRTTKHR